MWSQICGKNVMLVHKVTLKISAKKKNTLKLKKLKITLFSKQFLRLINPFFSKSETTFLNQFSLNYSFLFSIQSSTLSRNMRKLRVKLRNGSIYPP